jgi:hypothetical protein
MALTSFIAGESISTGDVVYISASGFLYKSSALYFEQASCAGLALDTGVSGDLIRVNPDFISSISSGLTPGEYRYVSILTSGLHVDYTAWASGLAYTYEGAYLTVLGRAVSSSGVAVELSKPIFVNNPDPAVLLETSSGDIVDPIFTEASSIIELET